MLTHLSGGFDIADIGPLFNRLVLGTFYILARFRFFYDPSKPEGQQWLNKDRHESLRNKMTHCGFRTYPTAAAWLAAVIEVGGGLLLIVGLFAPVAALGLLVLTVVATCCTWRVKVYEQNPVDKIDVCSCYLWRVEGLYIVMAVIVILAGPGAFSLSEMLL